MKTKPKILICGFSTPGTGYGRVLTSLFEYWVKDYEIHFAGIGNAPEKSRFRIHYYSTTEEGGDLLGAKTCERLVMQIKPQIVLLLNDLTRINPLIHRLSIYKPAIKLIVYFPVEGKLTQPAIIESLQYVDRIVSYTTFGKEEIVKAEKLLKIKNPNFVLPPIEIIQHGVDTRNFRPAPKVDSSKKIIPRYLKGLIKPGEEGFLVLNGNQFQFRKQIRTTLEGFCLFAKNKKENVQLILHHTFLGKYGYQSLVKLIRQVDDFYNCGGDLVKRVIISPQYGVDILSQKDLVSLYRLCDVGVNTSAGEGWGMVSFEHAATGAAQIVPKHSSCKELWEEAALYLDKKELMKDTEGFQMELCKLSSEQLSQHLDSLYSDRILLNKISRSCYEIATKDCFQWSTISKKWKLLFDQVLKEKQSVSPMPVHFNFRSQTIDSAVFRMVVKYNEYCLPDKFSPGEIIMDIGAHIGCFSYLALEKGAKVFAFEPEKRNFENLNRHLDFYTKQGNLVIENAAIWSNHTANQVKYISRYPENGWNTGGATVVGQNSGTRIKVLDFDSTILQITSRENKRIRMVKLDCEGAEWAILFNARHLDKIDEICGEYHEYGGEEDTHALPEIYAQYPRLTTQELTDTLQSKGFEVKTVKKEHSGKPERIGLFFAKKKV